MAEQLRVWLVLDPYPDPEGGPEMRNRVHVQPEPLNDYDLPPNVRRTRGWVIRVGTVDKQAWTDLLEGRLTPAEQNEFHRRAWIDAGGEDLWQPSA